jgi:hypothetical protein
MTEEVTSSSTPKNRSWFWPLFLVLLGFLLLLNNFDIISWSIWNSLFRFWPILLIFSGLEILLGRSKTSTIFITTLGLLVFGFILFISLPDPNQILSPLIETWSKIFP